MDFSNISDELKAKAQACKSTDELLALAKSEGVELSEEQLEAVAGGVDWGINTYPPTDGSPCTGYVCAAQFF